MSQDNANPSDQPGGDVRDSRLESFLRQASAIIAAEKGLTSAAKAKLEDLAERLHLPESLFSIALQQLQASNAPIGALTAYERGFLKFLNKEFSRMPAGTVLSISMEEKAIAHAKNKFEIPAHRAEQLIEHQTGVAGFGRLSRSDAREFGRQSILDLIGEQTQLDEKTEGKVYRLGRRWGFSAEEVTELVDARIRENSRHVKVQRRRPAVLGFGLLLCIGAICAGTWWLYENRERFSSVVASNVELDSAAVQSKLKTDETAVANSDSISELESLFPEHAASMLAESADQRIATLDLLLQQYLASPTKRQEMAAAIGDWYFNERDPIVANRLVQLIESNLAALPKTTRNEQLYRPYRIATLAVEILTTESNAPIAASRKESIRSVIGNRVASSAADVLSITAVKTGIARQQWSQLNQSAFSDAARTSILVQPLVDVTQPLLQKEQLHDFADRCIKSVLSVDSAQWRNMETSIRDAIENSDEVQRMEWISIWLDEYDGSSGFRELTAPKIAESLGTKLPNTSAAVEALFRSARSSRRNRLFRPAIVRHKKLNERVQQLRPLFNASNRETLPELVFLAAQSANLCLEASAILKSGKASEEAAWNEFDIMFGRLDQRLGEFVFLDETNQNKNQPFSSAGFDTTARDRDLGVFADLSSSNQPRRLGAIERLPRLIERFDYIPNAMANDLADYLTSPIEPDEWLKMQRVIPLLTKWPRVLLAISDRLPESTADVDQTVTLCNLLTGEIWQGDKSSNWKLDLAREVFALADEILRTTEVIHRSASENDWLRLEKFLQTAYRRRGSILGRRNADRAESVFDLAAACVEADSNNTKLKPIIAYIDSATDNEIVKVTLLNQMLINKYGGSKESKTAGKHLLQSENELLQVWLDRLNQQVAEIVDE